MIDPSYRLSEVDGSEVLSFKTGMLMGGAKKTLDAVKARVIKSLEAHDVFKDACADRAGAFLQKADIETIAKHEDSQDNDFWNIIKQEANRVHFRLVYRNELQQHKKDERKKPPAKHGKKTREVRAKKKLLWPTAANVTIDIEHFKDGDDAIEMLESTRFGPD